MCNLPLHREGHLPGTTYNKLERKWKSQIYIDGRKVGLGTYCTQQEAHEAYTRKLKSMDTVQGRYGNL